MREHLTFANVMSCIAVFIALGGTALAIKANSVGSRQVKPESLKGVDVKDESLKGTDLADDTITSREINEAGFALGEITSVESAQGFCDPNTADFQNCGTAAIELSAPSRAILFVGGSQQGPAGSKGTCKARMGSQNLLDSNSVNVGDPAARGIGDPNGFALTVASDEGQLLPAGAHNVSILCNEISGDVEFDTTFTVLALSAREN
jgi:hypothetical protein